MSNIKLVIAYDGTRYFGWQATPTGPSIEETLQQTLEQILQHPVALQAASRTDAGVHAIGQVVNFITSKSPDLVRLTISLNQLLPKDVAVMDASFMDEAFHPTLDVTGKTYRYSLCNGTYQLPQLRGFSWHYPHALDLDAMKAAATLMQGQHNFSALCNQKKHHPYHDYVRLVSNIEFDQQEHHELLITVHGQNFLYRMVRNLVGTLVYVGVGKIAVDEVPTILSSQQRILAGPTAPAHGLTLVKVLYE